MPQDTTARYRGAQDPGEAAHRRSIAHGFRHRAHIRLAAARVRLRVAALPYVEKICPLRVDVLLTPKKVILVLSDSWMTVFPPLTVAEASAAAAAALP